jgi:hypothetical protein
MSRQRELLREVVRLKAALAKVEAELLTSRGWEFQFSRAKQDPYEDSWWYQEGANSSEPQRNAIRQVMREMKREDALEQLAEAAE